MKHFVLAGMILFSLAACTQTEVPKEVTPSPIPLTATSTSEPTKTPVPSPTPALDPFKIQNGQLLVYNEQSCVYSVVEDDVATISQSDNGMWVARDNKENEIFRVYGPDIEFLGIEVSDPGNGLAFQRGMDGYWYMAEVTEENEAVRWFVAPGGTEDNLEGQWQVVEVKIPEGAENHEELAVPDRHVSVVNEQGKVEEIVESGVKVLVNPETGEYEYELVDGEWVEYEPRVQLVGEVAVKDHPKGYTEVPREVVENTVETVKNAQLLTRDGVELKTGYAESLGKYKGGEGYTYISWYGVFCGANISKVEFSDYNLAAAFMGMELNSGDVMLVTVMFTRDEYEWSNHGVVFDGREVPASRDNFNRVGDEYGIGILNQNQMYEAVASAPVGTPFYISTQKDPVSDRYVEEMKNVIKALETGELDTSEIGLTWHYGEVGASDDFWESVIDR